nr:hypothetical protein CFP56_78026 [Quercus suber]POF27113.1 hypothetical protein CFP56_28944 [Quercus suber]
MEDPMVAMEDPTAADWAADLAPLGISGLINSVEFNPIQSHANGPTHKHAHMVIGIHRLPVVLQSYRIHEIRQRNARNLSQPEKRDFAPSMASLS